MTEVILPGHHGVHVHPYVELETNIGQDHAPTPPQQMVEKLAMKLLKKKSTAMKRNVETEVGFSNEFDFNVITFFKPYYTFIYSYHSLKRFKSASEIILARQCQNCLRSLMNFFTSELREVPFS